MLTLNSIQMYLVEKLYTFYVKRHEWINYSQKVWVKDVLEGKKDSWAWEYKNVVMMRKFLNSLNELKIAIVESYLTVELITKAMIEAEPKNREDWDEKNSYNNYD